MESTPEPMAEVMDSRLDVMPVMSATPLVSSEMRESTWAFAAVAPIAATMMVEKRMAVWSGW